MNAHAFSSYLFLYILLFTNTSIQAQTLSATAYGADKETARQNALADLSSQIAVTVKSTSDLQASQNGSDFKQSFKREVLTRSELPLYGVQFKYRNTGDEIVCSATLSKDRSFANYEMKIRDYVNKIDQLLTAGLDKLPIQTLDKLVIYTEELEKVRIVAGFLGFTSQRKEKVSLEQIKEAIEKRTDKVSTMNELTELVKRNLGNRVNNVYVYPARYEGSSEITGFGRSLKNRLTVTLNASNNQLKAEQKLVGSYREVNGQLELSLRLLNPNNEGLAGVVMKLTPAVFENQNWKPKTNSIDQLMQSGQMVSSDFTVQLTTNRGSSDLLFENGEEVELFVKANKSGYIYIVGHNTSDANPFSYLLPFGDGYSKRDMILFINGDDVNRWVSLGAFTVSPPNGVERLQAFGSTKDPIDLLPEFYVKDDYPVLGKDPSEVVVSTRGLIRKKKKKENLTAEAILNFTTMEK